MARALKNPDRHDKPGVLARPTPEIRDAAKNALAEQPGEWTMNDFLVACMVLLTKNPKAMLERLAEFRPPPKKGRPPKRTSQSPS